jgi:hypothetical protein
MPCPEWKLNGSVPQQKPDNNEAKGIIPLTGGWARVSKRKLDNAQYFSMANWCFCRHPISRVADCDGFGGGNHIKYQTNMTSCRSQLI